MEESSGVRPHLGLVLVGAFTAAWAALLLTLAETASEEVVHLTSNLGLALIALVAGAAAIHRAEHSDSGRVFWLLIGLSGLAWAGGQAVWTWQESVIHRDPPFPSVADAGYLGLPLLAAGALLCLPLATRTVAVRLRTMLDGLIVAMSLLLVSWIIVLGPVFRADGDTALAWTISLAYPVGDISIIAIVVFTWLRARACSAQLPSSLPLVGGGLTVLALANSASVYIASDGGDSRGSVVAIGWFLGFALLVLAATRTKRSAPQDEEESVSQYLGTFLPYSAVMVAIGASATELIRTGTTDAFIAWDGTALMMFLIARQVLTLRENVGLTKHLEDRVRARTAELHSSRQRFAALVQHSSDVVTVIGADGLITYQSESCRRVLGREPESMTGTPLWTHMAEDQVAALKDAIISVSREPLRLQTLRSVWLRPDGRQCHLEVTITNLLLNDDVAGLVLNSRDVTDRTLLQDQLLYQAFHDSLTSLYNRAMFKERLEHALTRRERLDTSLAVLFLDLDGFKEVNDTLGHSAGDSLLVQVAGRLLNLVRPSDTVARFGGDEFAILVEALEDADYVITLAQRLNASLREPYDLAGTRVHLSVSVGIAHDADITTDAEHLLRNADLAMYQAKSARDGGYAIYDPSMHVGLVERVRLEADLRQAVESGGLEVHYQPLINMGTGQVTGVEALARWTHLERGAVSPTEFIPLAEATGLIRSLGRWVLEEACAQTVAWQSIPQAPPDLRISVNVSPRQLFDDGFAAVVAEVLAETGLRPELLTLEMTESVLMSDSPEAVATLRTLRSMGVRLAIDDFGTGYSSLSYLHRFPIDVLKIDRSFIEQLSRGGDSALVSTIVRLGNSMDLETVAEGIERADEMSLLRLQGCTTGQGYHFSRPLPPDELSVLLADHVPLSIVHGIATQQDRDPRDYDDVLVDPFTASRRDVTG
ncbi:MAG: EAL domain-containing protein [Nocardioidaceae bacterium]